jgi:TetR/AcrR family transcriptional regulator, copper-responsive repressor
VIDTYIYLLKRPVNNFIVNSMETNEPMSRGRGRPRAFDRQRALNAAMLLFWRRGYESTSISELSSVMAINPPSLYAAFGDKRELFNEAVAAYETGPGCFAAEALNADIPARAAIHRLLMEAAQKYTDQDSPPGCMVVLSATNGTADSADVRETMKRLRNNSATAIRERIAGAAGKDFPADQDPTIFANLLITVFQGMSLRALDGAAREELEATAEQVMLLWPG